MKKLICGCAVVICGLLMPQVTAQDVCCPSQYPSNYYGDGGCFDGFYLGGNLGIISHTAHRSDQDNFLTDNSGWTTIDTDFTAGVQLGYDWLCYNKLFGLVADWNWTNVEEKLKENPNSTSANYVNSEFDWFSTFRARTGMTICDALIYITGGAALGRFHTTWFDDPDKFKFHDTRWGWTGGVGAEFLAWCNWSVGAELLFLQFSHDESSSTSSAGSRFTFGHSDSAWIGRVSLNYRFGDLSCWCS